MNKLRRISLYCIFLAQLIAFAQEREPVRLEYKGSVPALRCPLDEAGHPCAKIIVYSNNEDLQISSNFLVGEIEHRVGMYTFFVNIPESDDGNVVIVCGSEALRVPLWNEGKLIGRQAYSLLLNFDKENKEIEEIGITLSTQPSGATIYIDDVLLGSTPLEIRLFKGSHKLEIEKAGYRPRKTSLNVTPERNSFSYALSHLEAGDLWEIPINGQKINMRYVNGGSFVMGTDATDSPFNQRPAHEVYLDGFWISEDLISLDLIAAINPQLALQCKESLELEHFDEGSTLYFKADSPHTANEIIDQLRSETGIDFQFPSEAQWEFAAQGGALSKGFKYSGTDSKLDKGDITYFRKSVPNELGILNMSADGSQLCLDMFDESWYANSPTNNPVCQKGEKHILRGRGMIKDRAMRQNPKNFFLRLVVNIR